MKWKKKETKKTSFFRFFFVLPSFVWLAVEETKNQRLLGFTEFWIDDDGCLFEFISRSDRGATYNENVHLNFLFFSKKENENRTADAIFVGVRKTKQKNWDFFFRCWPVIAEFDGASINSRWPWPAPEVAAVANQFDYRVVSVWFDVGVCVCVCVCF